MFCHLCDFWNEIARNITKDPRVVKSVTRVTPSRNQDGFEDGGLQDNSPNPPQSKTYRPSLSHVCSNHALWEACRCKGRTIPHKQLLQISWGEGSDAERWPASLLVHPGVWRQCTHRHWTGTGVRQIRGIPQERPQVTSEWNQFPGELLILSPGRFGCLCSL